jgi:uncharacterized membrane protein
MVSTSHIHPMIVHFPIALITIGFLADVVYLFLKEEKWLLKSAFYLMLIGTLGSIAAWASGHLFTSEPVQGAIVEVFEKHETGALITMIVMLIGSSFRIWLVANKREESLLKWVAFAIYFIGFCAVTFTGLMGGTMVYNYMMPL